MKDGAKYLVKLDENGIGISSTSGSKTDVSKKALYKITASGAEKLNTVFTESDTAVSGSRNCTDWRSLPCDGHE